MAKKRRKRRKRKTKAQKEMEQKGCLALLGIFALLAVFDYISGIIKGEYGLMPQIILACVVLSIPIGVILFHTNSNNKTQDRLKRASVQNYEQLPRLEHPKGYVYIIQDVEISKQYKIGRTNHPKTRLNKFGVELPFETKVIHIIQTPDAVKTETQLHKKYARKRTNGEWFDLTDKQLTEVKAMG